MSCDPLVDADGRVAGYICRAGSSWPTGAAAEKWCFGCRKRITHHRYVWSAEWYDPEYYWLCARCGEDRTHGFGQ